MEKWTKNKWYSNGLKAKEAEKLRKIYVKIENPLFGLEADRGYLALRFGLNLENGYGTDYHLANPKDIKELFVRTKTFKTSQLEGKIIEAYADKNLIKGLSVNENLI